MTEDGRQLYDRLQGLWSKHAGGRVYLEPLYSNKEAVAKYYERQFLQNTSYYHKDDLFQRDYWCSKCFRCVRCRFSFWWPSSMEPEAGKKVGWRPFLKTAANQAGYSRYEDVPPEFIQSTGMTYRNYSDNFIRN